VCPDAATSSASFDGSGMTSQASHVTTGVAHPTVNAGLSAIDGRCCAGEAVMLNGHCERYSLDLSVAESNRPRDGSLDQCYLL